MNLIPAGVAALTLLTGTLPDEVQSVVTANNQFALDLYCQVRTRDGNIFFSPYSIPKALAMTYTGARGETAREMAATLHFSLDPNRQPHAFAAARNVLNGNHAWPKSATALVRGANGVQIRLA